MDLSWWISIYIEVNFLYWIISFFDLMWNSLTRKYENLRILPLKDEVPLTITIKNVAINTLITTPVTAVAFYFIFGEFYIHSWNAPLYKIVCRVLILFLTEEFFFYYFHRLFHSKFFYKYHKLHHQYTSPMMIATLYCHPLEQALCNVFPVLISARLSRLPVMYFRYWIILALLNAMVSHSGTIFARYHTLHHTTQLTNYGVLTLLDRLCGTYRAI